LHTLEFKIYEKEAQAKRLRELFPVVASLNSFQNSVSFENRAL